MDGSTDRTVTPIGIVRSAWASRSDIPLAGGPAVLEILPEYEPALEAVERSSHVLVLAWLHRADRTVLRARPRKYDPESPEQGVFATRSPDRPNPVSVSVVPLVRRDGLCLHVDRMDLLDGTPLLDLKPYNPGWDGVFGARHPKRVRQSRIPDDMLAAFLRRDLENHLGPDPIGASARIGLAAVFAAIRAFDVDGRDPRLSATLNRCDGSLDAVIGLTGGCFQAGRVSLDADGGPHRFRFDFEGRTLSLVVRDPCAFDGEPSRWVQDGFYVERR